MVLVSLQVPLTFILLLLAMFVSMLIDRALFLRGLVFDKFIYQIVLMFAVHIWMFFILPRQSER